MPGGQFGALLAAGGASAQSWPAKPIKLIVPWPPGGPTDTGSRIVGLALARVIESTYYFLAGRIADAGRAVDVAVVTAGRPPAFPAEQVEAGNADEAKAAFQKASRKLNKAVSKGVLHRNNAANRKSKLAKKVNAL